MHAIVSLISCESVHERAWQLALIHVKECLQTADQSLRTYGMTPPPMPTPERPRVIQAELSYDPAEQQRIVDDFCSDVMLSSGMLFMLSWLALMALLHR